MRSTDTARANEHRHCRQEASYAAHECRKLQRTSRHSHPLPTHHDTPAAPRACLKFTSIPWNVIIYATIIPVAMNQCVRGRTCKQTVTASDAPAHRTCAAPHVPVSPQQRYSPPRKHHCAPVPACRSAQTAQNRRARFSMTTSCCSSARAGPAATTLPVTAERRGGGGGHSRASSPGTTECSQST